MELNNVTKRVVFLRADGGSNIGMGHVMRMLVLASELKKKYIIYFLCISNKDYEHGINKIKQSDFDVITLSEENLIDDIIFSQKKYNADVLITDNYNVDEEYFDITSKYFDVTGYIDDLNLHNMNVDFVINPNIMAEKIRYETRKDTKLFLGTKFCMMREEFRKTHKLKYINSKINDVLVTVGGMDASGLSTAVVDVIKNFNLKIHVVIGAAFSDVVKENLKKLAKIQNNIILYENAVMSDLMLKCDVAVSACGSTLYELCAMNVPAIGIIVADNQEQAAANMKESGAVYDIVHLDELNNISSLLSTLMEDNDLRKRIIDHQKDIVNVNGAKLLAENIEKIIESRCTCGKVSY